MTSIVAVNIGVLLLANLMMLYIYRRKLPFFENYRISNVPAAIILEIMAMGRKP